MTPTDLVELEKALLLIKKIGLQAENIAIHSPWEEQTLAIIEMFDSVPKILDIDKWHLNNTHNESYDILILANVLMYCNSPTLAINNIFNSCKYVLIQDVIIRNRGENIFGTDGDCMRYCHGEIKSNFDKAYDLAFWRRREVFFIPYFERENLHFITLMKGNIE